MQVSARTEAATGTGLIGEPTITHEIRLRSTRRDIVVQFEGQAPPWLPVVLDRIEPLLELQENWNSYGALPISPDTVARGVELLGRCMEETTPPPQIIPTVSGSIQFEWHLRGGYLEFELLPNNRFGFYHKNFETGQEQEEESAEEVQLIRKALTQLTSRPAPA
jgi:hypothetical protein